MFIKKFELKDGNFSSHIVKLALNSFYPIFKNGCFWLVLNYCRLTQKVSLCLVYLLYLVIIYIVIIRNLCKWLRAIFLISTCFHFFKMDELHSR